MKKLFLSLFAALLACFSAVSHAALPTEATAAFTQLSIDSASMTALIWPILGTVTGSFVLMKLFKRGANRAV